MPAIRFSRNRPNLRKAAERRRQQREQLSPFNRLRPGEKKHSKRMATVAAVYSVAPLVRSAEDFLQSLMPRQPGDNTNTKAGLDGLGVSRAGGANRSRHGVASDSSTTAGDSFD